MGFRATWNVALRTVGVGRGGPLPVAHALAWWIRGVPTDKVEQAVRGTSPWDRMSSGERRLYALVGGGCVVLVFGALLVGALTR
jgi:hypothetical protein